LHKKQLKRFDTKAFSNSRCKLYTFYFCFNSSSTLY